MVRWSLLKRENHRIGSSVKLVAQIHDELLFEVEDDTSSLGEITPIIERLMCTVFNLKVPIEVNMNHGLRWGSLEASTV
jgi:DNA polymerase I-like protein with 3'-5' exonuclease and polymerase domains